MKRVANAVCFNEFEVRMLRRFSREGIMGRGNVATTTHIETIQDLQRLAEREIRQRLEEAGYALVAGNEDRAAIPWAVLDDWLFYVQTGSHRDGDEDSIFEGMEP